MKIIYTYYVDNKAKRWISKRVFQENKHAKFSEKQKFLLPDTHMYVGVRIRG